MENKVGGKRYIESYKLPSAAQGDAILAKASQCGGFHIPREIGMFPEMCSVCVWAGYRVVDNTGWTISLVNTCLTDKAT